MSDTPQDGWWQANDGNWYPPETHPDYVPTADELGIVGPPAVGWWQANDGNWYPPETHPSYAAPETIDLTEQPGSVEEAATPPQHAEPLFGGAASTVSEQSTLNGEARSDSIWDVNPTAGVGTIDPASAFAAPESTAADQFDPVATDLSTRIDTPADPEVIDLDATVASPFRAEPSTDQVDVTESSVPAGFAPPPLDAPAQPSSRPPLFGTPAPVSVEPAVDEGSGQAEFDDWFTPPAAEDAPPAGAADTLAAPPVVPDAPIDEWLQEPAAAPPEVSVPTVGRFDLSDAQPASFDIGSAPGDLEAPLPGWQRGADGSWYPPDQVPPQGTTLFPRATHSAATSAPGPSAGPPPAGTATTSSSTGGNRRLLVIGAAVAAVLAIGVLAFVLLGGDDGESGTTTVATPTTEQPAEPEPPPTTVAPDPSISAPEPAGATGDKTVDVGRVVTEQYLALITHDGAGPFTMSLLSPDGQVSQELVVDTQGTYLGVKLVNPELDQAFSRIQVRAAGKWGVAFAPVPSAPTLTIESGQSYEGTGDEVLGVFVDSASTLDFSCVTCAEPVEVRVWGEGVDLGSTTINNDGEVALPPGATTVQFDVPSRSAPPDWSVTVR